MDSIVFRSILALDSYNHGYGENLSNLPATDRIGTALIKQQSNTNENSYEVNAGFYAIAYQWNGQIVIITRKRSSQLRRLEG